MMQVVAEPMVAISSSELRNCQEIETAVISLTDMAKMFTRVIYLRFPLLQGDFLPLMSLMSADSK